MFKTEDNNMVAYLNHGVTCHVHSLAVAYDTADIGTIGQAEFLYRFLCYKTLSIDREFCDHCLDEREAFDA